MKINSVERCFNVPEKKTETRIRETEREREREREKKTSLVPLKSREKKQAEGSFRSPASKRHRNAKRERS